MAKHDFMVSPTSEGKASTKPTGDVETEGKVSTIDLPKRSMGPDSIQEVFYDKNADLPSHSYGKK